MAKICKKLSKGTALCVEPLPFRFTYWKLNHLDFRKVVFRKSLKKREWIYADFATYRYTPLFAYRYVTTLSRNSKAVGSRGLFGTGFGISELAPPLSRRGVAVRADASRLCLVTFSFCGEGNTCARLFYGTFVTRSLPFYDAFGPLFLEAFSSTPLRWWWASSKSVKSSTRFDLEALIQHSSALRLVLRRDLDPWLEKCHKKESRFGSFFTFSKIQRVMYSRIELVGIHERVLSRA